MVQIVDDFLDKEEFEKLQNLMMTDAIHWFYWPNIDTSEDKDKFQFIHSFYQDKIPASSFVEHLNPVLQCLNPLSVYRIKANLLTRTEEIIKNSFHVDIPHMSEEKQSQWTTAILYMNTNNGYTEFADGLKQYEKVESVENRVVIFPANMKHRGTSCTDEKSRVVINFNYFKHEE